MKYHKLLIIFIVIMLSGLVACNNSNDTKKNNTIESETEETEENIAKDVGNDISIVSHKLENDGEYYKITFTIKNKTNDNITYEYIGLRTIGDNNIIKDDFNSNNQAAMETKLEPNQICEQENTFLISDKLKQIEVDSYGYYDKNENYIEKDLTEKYIVDLSE